MIVLVLAFVATLLGGIVFPWWWPCAVGVVMGFWMRGSAVRVFNLSALSAGLAWSLAATLQQILNHGLLAGKVATIFHLPGGGCLLLITGILGGLTAGLASLVGRSLRSLRTS